MNNKKLKKALLHIGNGRNFQETGQFIDMEWRLLKRELSSIGVEDEVSARKKLKAIQDEESALPTKIDRSEDKSGQIVPEFKTEPTEYKGNFDRASAIVNEKENTTQERIPLSEHREFRRDMKQRGWVQILKKWGEKYNLDEDSLMEQAVLLSPSEARDRFGFGKDFDSNMEGKRLPR